MATPAESTPVAPPMSRGTLGLARSVPGSVGFWDADATFEDGRQWRVRWNRRAHTAQVLDAGGALLGWMEADGKKGRRFKLADGPVLPVTLTKKWFSWRAVMDGMELKLVFMLEGSRRVFGTKRLHVVHRDFKSDVAIKCEPGLEIAAVILAFLLFNAANCSGDGE